MGSTRPLLVASIICILLAGEIVIIATQGELRVHGVVQGNAVFFSWSSPETLADPDYHVHKRFKKQLQGRYNDRQFFDWFFSRNRNTNRYKTIPAPPYSRVTLEAKLCGRTKVTSASVDTTAKVPTTAVTQVVANVGVKSQYIQATVDNKCHGDNGPNMYVQFVLTGTNKERFPTIRKNITIEGRTAKLNLTSLKLLPFMNYTVTAIPGNSMGEATDNSLFRETTFKTRPGKPGKVRNLKVVNASHDSLKVTWSAPDDDPPTGILEKYIVRYMNTTLTGEGITEYVNETTTSLLLRGLHPDTAYNITVEAKNKNVNTRSDAAQVIGNTTEEKAPLPVVGLNNMAETNTTTLYLQWSPPGNDTVACYMVSLHDEETLKMKTNTTKTTAKFNHLTAGKMYMARVRACSKRGKCSNNTEVVAWTRPEKPKVKETKQSLAPTDSTVKIQLPTVKPPAIHWVVLKRYEEPIKNEESIKTEAKDTVSEASEANLTTAPSSQNKTTGDDTKLRIVDRVEVEADSDGTHMYVTLGGDGKSKLKSGSNYVAVVVVETNAGYYREYYACDPMMFTTQQSNENLKALGLIGGICAGAVVLAVVITLLVAHGRKEGAVPVCPHGHACFSCIPTITMETSFCNDLERNK